MEKLALIWNKFTSWVGSLFKRKESPADKSARAWISLYETVTKYPGGDVSLVRTNGTVVGTFDAGKGIDSPWGLLRHRYIGSF